MLSEEFRAFLSEHSLKSPEKKNELDGTKSFMS